MRLNVSPLHIPRIIGAQRAAGELMVWGVGPGDTEGYG